MIYPFRPTIRSGLASRLKRATTLKDKVLNRSLEWENIDVLREPR